MGFLSDAALLEALWDEPRVQAAARTPFPDEDVSEGSPIDFPDYVAYCRRFLQEALKSDRHGNGEGIPSVEEIYESLRELLPAVPIRDALLTVMEDVRLKLLTQEDPVCRRLPKLYTGPHRGRAPAMSYGVYQAVIKTKAKTAFRQDRYFDGNRLIAQLLRSAPQLVFDPATMGEAMTGANLCRQAPQSVLLAEHQLQLDAASVRSLDIALHSSYHLGFWHRVLKHGAVMLRHPEADAHHHQMAGYFMAKAAFKLKRWDFLIQHFVRHWPIIASDSCHYTIYFDLLREVFLSPHLEFEPMDCLIRILQRDHFFSRFIAHFKNRLPASESYGQKVLDYLTLRNTLGWPQPDFD